MMRVVRQVRPLLVADVRRMRLAMQSGAHPPPIKPTLTKVTYHPPGPSIPRCPPKVRLMKAILRDLRRYRSPDSTFGCGRSWLTAERKPPMHVAIREPRGALLWCLAPIEDHSAGQDAHCLSVYVLDVLVRITFPEPSDILSCN